MKPPSGECNACWLYQHHACEHPNSCTCCGPKNAVTLTLGNGDGSTLRPAAKAQRPARTSPPFTDPRVSEGHPVRPARPDCARGRESRGALSGTLTDDVAKPTVDPFCMCGEPHPCPEHGRPEDSAPQLFVLPPVRVGR